MFWKALFSEPRKGQVFGWNKSDKWFRDPLRARRFYYRDPVGVMHDQFTMVKGYPLAAVSAPIGLKPALI